MDLGAETVGLKREREEDTAEGSKRPRSEVETVPEPQIDIKALLLKRAEQEAYLQRLQDALAAERARSRASPSTQAAAVVPAKRSKPVTARKPSNSRRASRNTATPAAEESFLMMDEPIEVSDAYLLKEGLRILDDLKKNRNAFFFNEPVDWEKLKIPDYPKIITEPMDLGTIQKKLEDSVYDVAVDFESDVQLVWDNAKKFNPPKTVVHQAAVELERIFIRKYSAVKRDKRGASTVIETASNAYIDFGASPSPKASKKKKPSSKAKPLTWQEKDKLKQELVKLPDHKLEGIVDIIGESSDPSGEVEIDMDVLDTATLRKLQQYVRKSVRPSKTVKTVKKPKAKSSSSAAFVPESGFESDASSDSDSSSSFGSDSDVPLPAMSTGPATPVHGFASASIPAKPVDPVEVVKVQNTEAWSNLSAPAEIGKVSEKSNPLWDDYMRKDMEKRQKEKEDLSRMEKLKEEQKERSEEELRKERERRLQLIAENENDATQTAPDDIDMMDEFEGMVSPS